MIKTEYLKKNESELTAKCRHFAEKEQFNEVFNLINKKPEVLNYLTIGELSRYCARGYLEKGVPKEDIINAKKNIKYMLFRGVLE